MTSGTQVRGDYSSCVDSTVLAALVDAYERGWQPADLLHVTRRSLGAGEVRLATRAIRHEARLSEAAVRAPRRWLEQVAEVAATPHSNRTDETNAGQRTALTTLLRHLPALPSECPPPSRWPHASARRTVEPATPAPVMLDRIRRLLTLAQQSEFTEQAETMTAKAQELITTQAVTRALRHAHNPQQQRIEVVCRRIHFDAPYINEKAQLLSEIGRSHTVRTVWFTKLGMATIIGTESAPDYVQLLYNSLLVQADNAMRQAGKQRPSPSSTAFRRAYLYGFAIRMGMHLYQTRRAVIDAIAGQRAVTPREPAATLRRQADAVDAELLRLLPEVGTIPADPREQPSWYRSRSVGRQTAADADPLPGDLRWSSETMISA